MYNHDIVNLDNPNNFVIRQTYFGLIFGLTRQKNLCDLTQILSSSK